MNAKHVLFLIVVGIGGAATALAQGDPAVATAAHFVSGLCTPLAAYLGLASTQILGKKAS